MSSTATSVQRGIERGSQADDEVATSRHLCIVRHLCEFERLRAAERRAILDGIPLVGSSPEAETLVNALLNGHAVPTSEPRDATHIAIATTNGIDYLASWNFKHILNPATMRLIESVCRDAGFDPPMLVTPQQLFEAFDDS